MRPHQESLAVISRYVSGVALCRCPWRSEARSHGRVCAAIPSNKLMQLPSHACVGVRFARTLQMHGDALFALVAMTTGVTQVRILGALNPLGSRVIQGGQDFILQAALFDDAPGRDHRCARCLPS